MSVLAVMSAAIDGSVLEGGGQILRNSVTLSALLCKQLSIRNIRSGRKPPGLKNQHRTGLELVAAITSGSLSGAVNGSTTVHFSPPCTWQASNFTGERASYTADPKTAGSTTLLLQISLPLLLFGPPDLPSNPKLPILHIRGGTNASQAPQIDYTTNVVLPFLHSHFSVPHVEINVEKRGYFPKGGGQMTVNVPNPIPFGSKIKPITLLERGEVKSISGIAHFAKLPNPVGQGMLEGAKNALRIAGFSGDDSSEIPISITSCREPNSESSGAGSGIVLWAHLSSGGILGGSAVGRKGLAPFQVGQEAANELINAIENGGVVDEWTQDQIIIFMALAEGKSSINVGREDLTLHTKSAIWVAEQLTAAKYSTEKDARGNIILHCDGIGYTPPL